MYILDVTGIDKDSLVFLDDHEPERCLILLQWIQRLIMEGMGSGPKVCSEWWLSTRPCMVEV
jgi:hypothetical protein